MKARFKYRIYPTAQQKTALAQLFGCVRVVWNDALAFCNEQYEKGEDKPKNSALQKQFITQAKQTENREWLGEVSVVALQQSLNDLEQAYQNFFKSCKGERKGKPVRPPRFKKKSNQQSARFTKRGFKTDENSVFIAKIGFIKAVYSRQLPGNPSSVTIIKDPSERYFASFVVEITPESLPATTKSCGIDLGIADFATFDNGAKVKAPKPFKKNLKRLRKKQRNLSRKQKGSKRREVARKKVAKLQAKQRDTRTDFLHKLSTKVIKENQLIALEDLNVSGLVKNRKLSRAISDMGWREFRILLENKAEKYSREFRVIDRWEATTQKCSCCGEQGGKKDLSIREWTCVWCGAKHDRDVNAAINILKVAGGHSETENGRGGKCKTTAKVAAPCEASTPFGDYP